MTTADELATFAPLSALSPAELSTLTQAARHVSFLAGQRMIVEGQPAQRCWLIRHGRVLLDSHVPGRGEVVVQTLGSGDLLGWSWLVPPYQWHFGAVAAGVVDTIEFDAATLAERADADPKFGHTLTLALFEALLERLQATRARLLDLYRNPAETCTPYRIDSGR
ncbi:cyclic nucleotide-binding domain-containing protein [Nocardia sp. NPDC046473]|uniref:Crp/Fnr family transcriptional regulator n=1 Tax=Nocardia sp. NPDC046473 TaxID=3155733 RepID=UPI0033F2B9F4